MVAPSGTGLVTTALAPMRAQRPTVKGPRICAPEPTITLSFKVGWRLVLRWLSLSTLGDVPPRVTPW